MSNGFCLCRLAGSRFSRLRCSSERSSCPERPQAVEVVVGFGPVRTRCRRRGSHGDLRVLTQHVDRHAVEILAAGNADDVADRRSATWPRASLIVARSSRLPVGERWIPAWPWPPSARRASPAAQVTWPSGRRTSCTIPLSPPSLLERMPSDESAISSMCGTRSCIFGLNCNQLSSQRPSDFPISTLDRESRAIGRSVGHLHAGQQALGDAVGQRLDEAARETGCPALGGRPHRFVLRIAAEGDILPHGCGGVAGVDRGRAANSSMQACSRESNTLGLSIGASQAAGRASNTSRSGSPLRAARRGTGRRGAERRRVDKAAGGSWAFQPSMAS